MSTISKFFSSETKLRLARSILTKDHPVYVQFYVTARCNLACEQCNIIYANSDVEEVSLDGIKRMADNFKKLGVSIILLTGGEPFARKDLPDIVYEFAQRGIHVRMQTNGLASEEQLLKCVENGGKDISISLDSLNSETQDVVNGNVANSWTKAINTISRINRIFPSDSFAALGCVLAPRNLNGIPNLIRFATAIGWYVSLVPAHTTPQHKPRNFRSFDPECRFSESDFEIAGQILQRVRELRDQGYLVYDSDEYLDDIYRFIKREPVQWRSRNDNVCDSPNLYFAVIPNGDMAVCCDYRLRSKVSTTAPDFVENFLSNKLRNEVYQIAKACDGCMYGSFPEMTISSRFMWPMIKRFLMFSRGNRAKLQPFSVDTMLKLAEAFRQEVVTT